MQYRQRHGGFTLLNLLVGMVISLIATVGLLTVFRNSIQVTAFAAANANNTGQLSALGMRASAGVQDAGYGIATPTFGTHIVPIRGAVLTAGKLTGTAAAAATSVNAVVWAMLTGATTQCAGLYAPTAGGLIYLTATNCTDATGWATPTWTTSTVPWNSSGSVPTITFSITQTSCAPYGVTATQGAYLFNLVTTDSIGASANSSTCLLNFQ